VGTCVSRQLALQRDVGTTNVAAGPYLPIESRVASGFGAPGSTRPVELERQRDADCERTCGGDQDQRSGASY
jgi:hypothetical protein